ncbi:MAG: hypothetical protein NVS1B3_07770 [Candidatus Dormibacteraceae bacterium]
MDCLIATVVIEADAPVLHADNKLELIAQRTALRLIDPGP